MKNDGMRWKIRLACRDGFGFLPKLFFSMQFHSDSNAMPSFFIGTVQSVGLSVYSDCNWLNAIAERLDLVRLRLKINDFFVFS